MHADSVDAAIALVCTLSPAGRDGRRISAQQLVDRATGIARLEDGVVLGFPGSDECARMVLEFVLAERECCAQFMYEIMFGPDRGPITLRVRATGAFVAALRVMYEGLARDAGIGTFT